MLTNKKKNLIIYLYNYFVVVLWESVSSFCDVAQCVYVCVSARARVCGEEVGGVMGM